MKSIVCTLVVLFLLFFSGCHLLDDPPGEALNLTAKAGALIEADNVFGFELFQKVVAYETEQDNIMVSPLSVSLALAMTYNGAEGETKTAMEETLKLYGLTTEDINTSYKSLMAALKSMDEKVLLEMANAIFYRDDFVVEPDFVTVNQTYYDAEVNPLDFGKPEAVDQINGWVADKTHDKITTIIERITRDQVMFLLNAVWFKGIWAKEFNPENTVRNPFYREDGTETTADMMCRFDTLDYMANDLFKAIKMPYGKGNYAMVVFLPEPGRSVDELVARLDKENWESWMKEFQETERVEIRFPKFNFKYKIRLNDVLSDMGMGIAFGGGADFSGINKRGGLFIGFVDHKTFIDVKEEGTEAAAVTIVSIERYSTVPPHTQFYVERPFLFAVTEKDTGAILFIGKVTNPEYH
jgi:serine protease inhibitor